MACTGKIFAALLLTTGPFLADAGTCKEPSIKGVCDCEHWSHSKRGYQCSGCKDSSFWGYGCDLLCPKTCKYGCEFDGDCKKPTTVNCKRNSRGSKAAPNEIFNDQGTCQACESGYHGLLCEDKCPEKCDPDTSEGACTRAGKCYKCKSGHYGWFCEHECPKNCPDCVRTNNSNLVDENDPEAGYLPAGACKGECTTGNFWGASCEKACPENCKERVSKAPTCLKETGECFKCRDHEWWGARCENKCSEGCQDGRCHKGNGVCEDEGDCEFGFWGAKCDKKCGQGCKYNECDRETGVCKRDCQSGYWGTSLEYGRAASCEKKCPNGTTDKGCDVETGMPNECGPKTYPDYISFKDRKTGCVACPGNCLDGQCDQDGGCLNGCQLGFHGRRCEQACNPKCIGECDEAHTHKSDGICTACEDGFTGRFCHKRCHKSCKSCRQRNDGVGPDDCESCRDDEPVMLKNGRCVAIDGAVCDEGGCRCVEPKSDSAKRAHFDKVPTKMCRFVCKEGYQELFGNKESMCVTTKVFLAIAKNQGKLEQGGCAEGQYSIPLTGSDPMCIRKDFVDNSI